MFNKLTRRAFTLIELIITIVIIGILSAVAIVGYSSVVDRSETAAAETTLRSIDREYRALDAFNIPADGSVGVDIDDMTPVDGVDFEAADANGNDNGLLESGEVIEFAGSSLSLRSAGVPGVIGAGDGDGGESTNVVTPIVPFQVSYDQQSFSTLQTSETLAPTVLGNDGTVTYSYAGVLPTGVSFDTATGEFTGPTTLNASATAISAGSNYSCVALSDGTVECWGQDLHGRVSGASSISDATSVVSNLYNGCALLSSGAVECWGADMWGGVSGASSVSGAVALSAGGEHTCALLQTGSVECWGNTTGAIPSSVVNATVTSVATGQQHTCAALSDGTVECWGPADWTGQVSGASSVSGAVAISAGGAHTCALLSDGTVECWGWNNWDQTAVPSSMGDATAVSAGYGHTCALLSDGTVECWGDNGGNKVSDASSVSGVTEISSSDTHSCALIGSGGITCWGGNNYGQTSPPAGLGNPGFPASIGVTATDGTNTADVTVELTVS